ncbi:cellulase family glycosylhydrolase [Tamlana sp. 2_MG-2023]|uniref:cellulase family glycosylhydrolase n=1 Tax=unclassified Tamlana TaxID=2614803 RepID=UPI0026E31A15|nr:MULTISPECIES: cellulase family glycosylhydrolase [unclassified Tamlana]MDO6761165.1 cellulase family glycosylhydrolase [Tamlana sp. 2_MG-2023]MDO6791502.1 cellulase family glycosylhydrolase [Tamlana sp. 1_MG-2023]
MKPKITFTYTLFLLLLAFQTTAQNPFGVNLAGADFGKNMPGTFGVDYTYPTENELDYYKSKGLTLVRLPFKWERIQPSLNGSLNLNELQRIKAVLNAAENRDMEVILDLHNYCRYKLNGQEVIIGSSQLSMAHIKDLWTKLAIELKDYSNIWGYGIMNEPHDLLVNAPWFDTAQDIINGIRTNDTQTNIIVGGDSWSSAERWMQFSDNLKNLNDPANKLIFEAHVYFDNDASGTYSGSYDTEGAYPNIGIDRVSPFVNWLQANNLSGFVGEYGVPANDSRWLTALDNFLKHLKQNCINGTYWAGGPWWGNYILSVEPDGSTDKPQMAILEKHLSTASACSTLSSNNIESDIKFQLFPNPFIDHIVIKGLKTGAIINIWDLQGRLVASQVVENSKISNLGGLHSGVYILKHEHKFIGRVVK